MAQIYHYTLPYALAKNYVLYAFRRFYGEIIIRGQENLPTDGSALIFAANHLNALMDALVVLSLAPPSKAIAFLARADLFNHKATARVLRFVKILPAFRLRDGFENLDKNNHVFSECIEVLRHGHGVCIMPEGGQGEERRLRPLVKGIFRIAFAAQGAFENERKVKIVPVGIEMEDLIKTGKHLIVNIGAPIDVHSLLPDYHDNAPTAINKVKDELYRRLSALTLDLASDKHYAAFETVTEIMADEYVDTAERVSEAFERFKIKQHTAQLLVDMERTSPEVMEELQHSSAEYEVLLKKLRFKSSVFRRLKSEQASVRRLFSLIITFPFFLFGGLTNALPMFVPVWVRKALKVEYSGFFSSVHFGLGLISFPLFYLLQTALFHLFVATHWGLTLFFFFSQLITRDFALRWYSNGVKYWHKARFNRLLAAKSESSERLGQLIALRRKIISLVTSEK